MWLFFKYIGIFPDIFWKFWEKIKFGVEMAKPEKKLKLSEDKKNSSSRRICPRPPSKLVFKKCLILKVYLTQWISHLFECNNEALCCSKTANMTASRFLRRCLTTRFVGTEFSVEVVFHLSSHQRETLWG